jgi:uncharacterized protein YecE (DUF72 family)
MARREPLVRIGTSGWSYPQGKGTWNGVFYPEKAAARKGRFDELAFYAERFDTVEVNSTFYRIPAPNVTASWARRTPAGFEFAVKLFQKFTHPAMFAKAHAAEANEIGEPDVGAFRAVLDPLAAAGKLGPILAQFPPSFRAEPAAWDYLRWLLEAFREFPLALELRHRTWSDESDAVDTLLDSYKATWVLIDEPKFRLSIRQRFAPEASGFFYVRLHGRNAEAWWRHEASEDRYNYLYSAGELEPVVEVASAARRLAKKLYVYMNNHFESKAVANAVMLRSQLGLENPGEYPETFVGRFPEVRELVRVEGKGGKELLD